MKKRRILSSGLAATLTVASLLSFNNEKVSAEEANTPEVEQIVNSMTLEEKVGQMLMPDFRNWKKQGEETATGFTEMNDEVASIIDKYHLGGVILFAENVVDTEQTVRLVDGLQKASKNIPLLIAIDQEGGIVTRLQSGTNLPGNMAIGATRSEENAYTTGEIIGKELSALGINTNFAPDLDVNNNPANPVIGTRSFGSNPQLVAELGIQTIKGLQDQNVVAAAKHFPGHGDTATDSHYGLPLVSHDKERLREVELYPFKKAIESGVDIIMTAHVQFPAFDDTTYISKKDGQQIMVPATLSRNIITNLLRDELGFDGVITTDALNMNAIAENFGQEEAVIMAINAGVDIALMPAQVNSLEMEQNLENVYHAVVDAVKNGSIPMEEIDDSVERIIKLKIERGIYQPDMSLQDNTVEEKVQNALKIVGNEEHLETEFNMATQAVTLLKNEDNTLPFKPKKNEKVLILAPYADQVEAIERTINKLVEEKRIKQVQIEGLEYYQKTFSDDVKKLIDEADYVITGSHIVNNNITVNNGVIDDTVQDEAKWATAFPRAAMNYSQGHDKKFVLMSVRNPYDVANFEEAKAVLAVYGYKGYSNGRFGQPNISAGIYTIFGASKPEGKLPVDIPSVVKPEQTLYKYGFGLDIDNGKPLK